MRLFATLSLALALAASATAQMVGSIEFDTARSMDGLYVDSNGDLFATGGFLGTDIYRIDPSGQAEVFATGISGPIHLVEAPDGNYYTTNFTTGVVSRITPDGVVSDFATVDQGPSDLVADADGNLYVTQFGDPAVSGDGDSVTKITPNGTVSTFAEGGDLFAPVGIDFDDEGNLFVANIVDGKIIKIAPDGSQTLFAQLTPDFQSFTIGHIVWHDGTLYATWLGQNRVVALDAEGTVTVVAGTGVAGRADGPVETATFTSPNGIAISPDGRTLYVSEYIGPNQRIRTISLAATSTDVPPPPPPTLDFGIAPNPLGADGTLHFRLAAPADVSITVYDTTGREVSRQSVGARGAGAHEVAWSAETLTAGVYVVRFQAGAEHVVRTVTVQR